MSCKADDLPAPEFVVNPSDIMVKFSVPDIELAMVQTR